MRKTKTDVTRKALPAPAGSVALRGLLKFEGKLRWQGDLDALRKRKPRRG